MSGGSFQKIAGAMSQKSPYICHAFPNEAWGRLCVPGWQLIISCAPRHAELSPGGKTNILMKKAAERGLYNI